MGISAIVLDLGNVLVLHDNVKLYAALARAFKTTVEGLKAGLDPTFSDRVTRGLLPGDALRRELVARLGVQVSEADFFAAWTCHFEVHQPMVEAVEALVGKKRLVLLSNTHDQHMQWVRPRLPLLREFNACVLSCEVHLAKPDPAIYARALAEAGVPAEQAVFFDDVEAYANAAASVRMHGRVFTSVADFERDLAQLDRG